jgi:hypothetical protein
MRVVYAIVAVVCWISPVAAQSTTPDTASIDFLRARRNADGGYAATAGAPDRSSLRATGSALRALKYLGGKPENIAETARFVEKCFDKSTGGFGDAPGEPATAISTALGTMAAVELKLAPERYRNAAVKFLGERSKNLEEIRLTAAAFEALQLRPAQADDWLRQITASRNADGTFGSGTGVARATGGTATMILRLGGTLDHRDAVLKAMRAGQRSDGGFGSADRPTSDLETSYRVMRAFVMLKERPADPAKLRGFIAKCRSVTGGYGEQAGQPPTVGGTYFAAIILHWLDQP